MSELVNRENNSSSVTLSSCRNCGKELSENYCAHCGQKRFDERFTLKKSFSFFIGTITNVDKGLWRVIIDLFKRPQKVISDYLDGATVQYFHPFRYMFLMVTFQVVIMLLFVDFEEIQLQANGLDKQQAQAGLLEFISAINRNIHLFTASSVPFLALGFWWMFGKKKYYYGEQLIIACYIYGHSAFITGVFSVFYILFGKELIMYTAIGSFFVSLAYMVYALKCFFNQNIILIFFKLIVSNIIWYLGLFFIMGIFMIAYFIFQLIKNPEFFNQFKPPAEAMLSML